MCSSDLLGAAALVFFAFIGFDEVITLAEETRSPSRTVPRALFLTVGLCTVLYVAVAIAATSVLGAGALAASRQPLADVMATAVGTTSGRVVAVIALVTTTNTTLLALTAASRLQYGMATTGALPRYLGHLDRRRVPRRALVTGGVIAAAFAVIGNLPLVAAVTDLSVFLVFVAVNTFFAIPDAAAQQQAFHHVAEQLDDGGRFVVEAFVPEAQHDGDRVDVRDLSADRVVLAISRTDSAAQRAIGQFVELRDGQPVRLRPWAIRWSTPEQLDAMATGAGLRLEHRWASWTGDPYGPDSTNHVSVYRKSPGVLHQVGQ